jgi:hypothetical protein
MFVLYAVLAGLIVGLLPGGSFAGLAELRIRWGGLILGGLIVQVVLFSAPVAERVHELGPLIYVVSTGAVLSAVFRNWRITGLPMVAVGAASNAAAILANGGFMPAGADAMRVLGASFPTIYSNSSVVAHPALVGLTDIFAIPRPLPFANVFSIGDVIIALGIAMVLIAAMRERDPQPEGPASEAPRPAGSARAIGAS